MENFRIAVLVICALLFGIGYFQNRSLFEMFMTSISLPLRRFPKGFRLSLHCTFDRCSKDDQTKCDHTEAACGGTLGTASVICSDKVCTLTQNKMTVTKFTLTTNCGDNDQADKDQPKEERHLKSVFCNDASLDEEDGEKKAVGDPTEVALVAAAHLHGLFKKEESKSERVIRFHLIQIGS